MSEYTELTVKIEALEKRVKYLEDTFATLADMNKSGEMGQYIAQRQRTLAASKLVNAAAGTQKLNADAQRQVIDQLTEEKAAMDARIGEAIRASAQNTTAEDDLAEQFTYRDVPGGVEIQGFNGFETGDTLVVPERIKENSVVRIGKGIFKNMNFKRVVLPNSIISFGEGAFEGCTELREITMPPELEEIGAMCFQGCSQLEKVILNDQLKSIELGAFSLTSVSSIIIPEKVQTLWNAFNRETAIAVLGMETELGKYPPKNVKIYCFAGSKIQREARRIGIEVKPLSKFENK